MINVVYIFNSCHETISVIISSLNGLTEQKRMHTVKPITVRDVLAVLVDKLFMTKVYLVFNPQFSRSHPLHKLAPFL